MAVRVDASGITRRTDSGPMSQDDYQSVLTRLVEDAARFMDDEISPSREEALNYLRGRTDVPEPATGFSSVTSTVSRDSLKRVMDKLLEMFVGAEDVVEFMPSNENDAELARQQTDVANYILMTRNKGYRVIHDTFRSAVGSGKVAGVKVAWDESTEVWSESYTDLSPEQAQEFRDDPNAEIMEDEEIEEEVQIPIQLPTGEEVRETVTRRYVNMEVKWKKPKNGIVIECIPAEELRFDRRAIDSDSARIIYQDTQRTRSDLVALGMTDEFIDAHGGTGQSSGYGASQKSQEKRARTGFDIDKDDDSGSDELMTYRLLDIWARIDKDGDGIAEWRHCLAIGNYATIWEPSDEMAHDCQIALFIPYLIENTAIGESLHELTKDIADQKTCLMRGMVDNVSLNNFPKMAAVETQIDNWASWQNRRAIGKMKRPGSVDYLQPTYIVDGVLKAFERLDQEQQGRIGVSDAAMGLDPDSLQASSDFGVRETFALGQSGILMVARNLAETGMTKLFQLIIKLYARHQNELETLRLRGQVIQINPRQFDAGMDLKVNVGLGTGNKEAKLGSLLLIKSVQEQAIASDGEDNAICNTQMYINTLDDILEVQDIKDEGRYFKNPPEPPQPSPDPAEAQMQAEVQKAQIEGQIELQKAQIQAQAKAQSDVQVAIIQAQVDLAKAQGEAAIKAQSQQFDALLKQQELETETALEIRAQNIEAAKDIELANRQLRSPVN